MKPKTILYIRNTDEHNFIDVFVKLFSSYKVESFVYDKYKPLEAIENINSYCKDHSIKLLVAFSFDAFLILSCSSTLNKCIFNACFKPATYIKTKDWAKVEQQFYLNYTPDKDKKVIAYHTLSDEVFGGGGYRILCTGFYKYVYRLSCGHEITYDACIEHKTKLLKWVQSKIG